MLLNKLLVARAGTGIWVQNGWGITTTTTLIPIFYLLPKQVKCMPVNSQLLNNTLKELPRPV